MSKQICQLSILQGAEYVLQLKEEKASLNKTVNFWKPFVTGFNMIEQVQALRSEAEQLSQEIAEFQAQLPTAGKLLYIFFFCFGKSP